MTDPNTSPVAFNANDPIWKPVLTVLASTVVFACGFFVKQGLVTQEQVGVFAAVAAPTLLAGGVVAWRAIKARIFAKKAITAAHGAPDSVAVVK